MSVSRIEIIKSENTCAAVTQARRVLRQELDDRLFVLRPSNARLVALYMTKQASIDDILRKTQVQLAKTFMY